MNPVYKIALAAYKKVWYTFVVDILKYKHWKYKNTALFITSFFVFLILAQTPAVKSFIGYIGSLGYFGAFLTGIFFVSVFTVAPATVVLFFLAQNYNPGLVSLFAGFGAVLGDYIIFRFLKDGVFEELEPLFERLTGSYFKKLFHTPYFSWLLPILGAAIIASPFPDEIGVGMMGLSKVKNWKFLIISFLLNTAGIFFLLALAQNLI